RLVVGPLNDARLLGCATGIAAAVNVDDVSQMSHQADQLGIRAGPVRASQESGRDVLEAPRTRRFQRGPEHGQTRVREAFPLEAANEHVVKLIVGPDRRGRKVERRSGGNGSAHDAILDSGRTSSMPDMLAATWPFD